MKHLQRTALTLCALIATQALAHSGHGMPGEIHWHASDAAGLAVVAGATFIAWWLARGE